MELAFDTIHIRAICESEVKAKHELGSEVAETLKHRLADLRAAISIKDLKVGQHRILEAENQQNYLINLCNDFRIVFCANHVRNPRTNAGDIDWERVSRIRIIWIGKSDDN